MRPADLLLHPVQPAVWPSDGQPLTSDPELFAGHPVHRDRTVELGGQPVRIRPVRPTDADTIDRFVCALSPDTRYRRFHTALRRLTPAQLAVLIDVDHHDRETLLALSGSALIGIGQYVRRGSSTAEMALVVADLWQRRGIGRALSEHLASAAAEAGITELASHVQADNPAPVELARSLSDRLTIELDRGEVSLTVHLQACLTGSATI